MKLFVLISIILLNKSSTSAVFDGAYLIFVGKNCSDYKILRPDSNLSEILSENYFDVDKPTVFITHGWRDYYEELFAQTIVKAYLDKNDWNIIFGEWGFYTLNPNYLAVAQSVSDVAKTYFKYLNKVKKTGYDLTRIHFVGHSLGAHVFGKLGEMFQNEMDIIFSRITGLDPAGPTFNVENKFEFFGLTFQFPTNPGLRRGNARLVDIVHSDADFTGTPASTGDLDFWPNGGKNQPSCTTCPSANGDIGMDCLGCDHYTSWRYYAESVRSSTPIFTAFRCPDDVNEFTEEACKGPETASMGFHAGITSKQGNYFVRTNTAAPFAQ